MNRDEKSVDISNAIRLLLEKDSIEIHFGKRIDEDNVEVVQKVLVSPGDSFTAIWEIISCMCRVSGQIPRFRDKSS